MPFERVTGVNERFQLPLLLTLNSTRRVWADASSGCL